MEISDEALEVAMQAALSTAGENWRDNVEPDDQEQVLQDMRVVLAAALPLIVGEPVMWVCNGHVFYTERGASDYAHPAYVADCDIYPVYAIKQGASRE